MGASTVAVGWSGYFVQMLRIVGIELPAAFTNAPLVVEGMSFHATGAIINLPAVLLVLALTGLLVLGIRESVRLNNFIVYLKVSIVLLVIVFGAFYVDPSNWVPFIPEQLTDPVTGIPLAGKFGWSGIFAGAGVIFFAYIGFDAVSTAAQEAKNPQRDLPIGILASLTVCTILYILMALVMTGLVPFPQLDVAEPVFVALNSTPALNWLKVLSTVGAVAGLASVVLVMLMAQPRIFYAMSRDGLLPPIFGKVHPKYKTPWLATLITGGTAAILAGLFPIGLLGHLVSIGTLFAFVIVCAGILVLRYQSPELVRPFRTPFVPFVPLGGILICGWLMYNLPIDTWLRLAVWMTIGVAIYFLYGRRHSKLGKAGG